MEKPNFGYFSTFKPLKHAVKIVLAQNKYQIRNPCILLHLLGTKNRGGFEKKFQLYTGFKTIAPLHPRIPDPRNVT